MDEPTAPYVTPGNVEAYIAELKDRVGSVTIYGSIYKLRRAAQLIAPGQDVRWMAEIRRILLSSCGHGPNLTAWS